MLTRTASLFALLLLLFVGTASAQPAKSVTLHFTRSANGWILIPAKVNGHLGSFVLDTGATDSFVSPKLIGENMAGASSRTSYLGGVELFRQISATVSLGDTNLNLQILLTSTERVGVLAKTRIDGIIGLNVLSQYQKVTLDLKAQTIVLEAR